MMSDHATTDARSIAAVVSQAIDHRFGDHPEEAPTWALALQLGTVERTDIPLELQFAYIWLWVHQYERDERIRADVYSKPRREDIPLVRSWIECTAGAEAVSVWRGAINGATENAIADAHDAAVDSTDAGGPPAGWLTDHAIRYRPQRPKPRRPQ